MPRGIHFVYDDRTTVPEHIAGIVGKRRYGSIVRNRRCLAQWVEQAAYEAEVDEITVLRGKDDAQALASSLRLGSAPTCFVHFDARGAVVDAAGMDLILRKIALAEGTLFDVPVNPIVAGFHDAMDYQHYLAIVERGGDVTVQDFDPVAQIILPDCVAVDLSDVSNFLAHFSSGFETRHFNQVRGDDLTVVKRSRDVTKLEREYRYYGLLPEAMQRWFVQPYNFRVEGQDASYDMERFTIADMALIWIHGAIAPAEFNQFLATLFRFVEMRPSKPVTREAYLAGARQLYIEKVRDRVAELKTSPLGRMLDGHVRTGTGYEGVNAVVDVYQHLFEAYLERDRSAMPRAVIGHGDLCFSNILYDKTTRVMKFVDPKGALEEDDLWTDPYYDLAKLSHSVLGNYDLINNSLFVVEIGDTLAPALALKGPDTRTLQSAFQRALEDAGHDVYGVRLREASLFLSMLPLHSDDPRKVLGLLLNAVAIIEELKCND